MIAAILFCFSMIAFGQFGLYYWRASVANIANQQVSNRVRVAAGNPAAWVNSRDFRAILSVHDATSDLRGPCQKYRAVRAYYFVVEKIGSLIPSVAGWAEAEMTMCSRYVAVLLDQHLERNKEFATQMRGI